MFPLHHPFQSYYQLVVTAVSFYVCGEVQTPPVPLPACNASSSRSGATQQARHCTEYHAIAHHVRFHLRVSRWHLEVAQVEGLLKNMVIWIEDPCLHFLMNDCWVVHAMTHGRLIVQSQPIESSLLYMEWSKNNLYCIRPRLIDGYSWWFSPCWSNVFFHVFVTVKSPMYWWLTPTEIEAAHPSRSGY